MPINARLAEILMGLPQKHRWVLTAAPSAKHPAGDGQISERHALRKLKAVLKKVDIASGCLHSFRRFFITHCANEGVAPFELARWVGHSDARMVMRYYKLNDDASQQAMARVDFQSSTSDEVFSSDESDSEKDRKQAQNKDNENGQAN